MTLDTLLDRARELADMWRSGLAAKRATVITEIRDNGLLAMMVFDMLPPRAESNDRNELAFLPTQASLSLRVADDGEARQATDIETLSQRAELLAERWQSREEDQRASVLKEIYKDGVLAMWVYEHLPGEDGIADKAELGESLRHLYRAL
ncbi:MAG: hypothetical protein HQL36_08500 [Alphaproteobacteria bacterium]|nr:hypothetical protein [Alphaproteobacteria bacterium]MBF0251704.1 hypothetical protein [Alphaproteobacteria bacterium]